MVGNNSSGSRSIVYGETKDKVLRVHAVLVGGGPLVFGQCRGADLASGLAGPGAAGPAAALAEVRERYRRPLAEDYPRTRRCTSGYNLRELLDLDALRAAPNLAAFARMAPLLAGD